MTERAGAKAPMGAMALYVKIYENAHVRDASTDCQVLLVRIVAILKGHLDRMGLKAEGRRKADLQQCLLDAVRDDVGDDHGDARGDAHSGEGGHAHKTRKGTKGTRGAKGRSKKVVVEAYETDSQSTHPRGRGKKGRAQASDDFGTSAVSASPVGRGRTRKQRSDRAEKSTSPAPAFSPDRVRFHREAVSAMSPEKMREALHELDMPSLRKEDDEVIHDLVDALVQRKAEAADRNPRKQAWRGRPVYMMRKAELQHMLQRFGKDGTGKAEELRTRFRAVLREWAADEIDIPISGSAGGAGGAGGIGVRERTTAFDPQGEDKKASSGTDEAGTGRPRGRETRTTRARKGKTENEEGGGTSLATPFRIFLCVHRCVCRSFLRFFLSQVSCYNIPVSCRRRPLLFHSISESKGKGKGKAIIKKARTATSTKTMRRQAPARPEGASAASKSSSFGPSRRGAGGKRGREYTESTGGAAAGKVTTAADGDGDGDDALTSLPARGGEAPSRASDAELSTAPAEAKADDTEPEEREGDEEDDVEDKEGEAVQAQEAGTEAGEGDPDSTAHPPVAAVGASELEIREGQSGVDDDGANRLLQEVQAEAQGVDVDDGMGNAALDALAGGVAAVESEGQGQGAVADAVASEEQGAMDVVEGEGGDTEEDVAGSHERGTQGHGHTASKESERVEAGDPAAEGRVDDKEDEEIGAMEVDGDEKEGDAGEDGEHEVRAMVALDVDLNQPPTTSWVFFRRFLYESRFDDFLIAEKVSIASDAPSADSVRGKRTLPKSSGIDGIDGGAQAAASPSGDVVDANAHDGDEQAGGATGRGDGGEDEEVALVSAGLCIANEFVSLGQCGRGGGEYWGDVRCVGRDQPVSEDDVFELETGRLREDEQMKGEEVSSLPAQATATAIAAVEGDEDSRLESLDKTSAGDGAAVDEEAEEAGRMATEDQVQAIGAHSERQDAEVQATPAGLEGESSSSLATQSTGQESTHVHVRARAEQIEKDFEAMLGQRTYREKRDTMNFLADPNSRPVNLRFPDLSAEQKQRVLRAGRSVESWDMAPILANDQEKQACILANQRAQEETHVRLTEKSGEEWRSAPSSEWIELVPCMKRRLREPIVRRGSRHGHRPQGTLGSAFVYFKSASAAGEGGRDAKRARLETRPGYDGDELTPMLRRLDDQDRDSAISQHRRAVINPSPRAPLPGAGTSLARVATGTVSRTPQPRRVGSRMSTGGSSFNRPRIHGAGTLGDWLGEARKQPHPAPTGGITSGNDRRRSSMVAPNTGTESFGQRGGAPSKRRADGQDPHPDGPQVQARGGSASPAAAGNKRAASSLGLEGMDATPRRKMQAVKEALTDEGKRLVRKVEAEAKATAEVGSILMSVVSQESKARNVTRQVREEQASTMNEQEQRQRAQPSGKQVRRSRAMSGVAEEQGKGQQKRDDKPGDKKARSETSSFTFGAPPSALLAPPGETEESSEFVFSTSSVSLAPARLIQQANDGDDDGADDVMSMDDASGLAFAFGAPSVRHVPARRAQPSYRFSVPTPATRAISGGENAAGGALVLASQDDGDDADDHMARDAPGHFEFSTKPRKARKTRGGVGAGRSAAEQMSPLAVAPRAVAEAKGSRGAGSDSGGMMTPLASTSVPPPVSAATTKGFDMSMFSKPGQWKCESCLVRNAPGTDKCAS
ncbi:unnamed protein product [Scytosiphon promiscuus]